MCSREESLSASITPNAVGHAERVCVQQLAKCSAWVHVCCGVVWVSNNEPGELFEQLRRRHGSKFERHERDPIPKSLFAVVEQFNLVFQVERLRMRTAGARQMPSLVPSR